MAQWIVVSSFLGIQFPWWKSHFAYLLLDQFAKCSSGTAAATLLPKILGGSYSIQGLKAHQDKALKEAIKKDPIFDTKNHLIAFIYDNIQRKRAKSSEGGASAKTRTVELRAMRIVLELHNSVDVWYYCAHKYRSALQNKY